MTYTLKGEFDVLGWSAGDFPNLLASHGRSADAVARARGELQKRYPDEGSFDIVAFGSLARYEMTAESDLDYLAVAYSLDPRPGAARRALDVADALRSTIGEPGTELRPPGASGIFGKLVSAPDIIEVIGLEGDTNHSHTRRILLLEESVSLLAPTKHETLIRSMIRRYLEAKPGTTPVPRFLLNDLARYWRTLTIDYQAKTTTASPYSLRYLKLILSRKFTFASSVLPLLLLERGSWDEDTLVSHLAETYQQPPLVRFLRAARNVRDSTPELDGSFRACVSTIDTFNGLLGSKDWRAQILTDSSTQDVKSQPTFAEGRALGQRLQVELENIFFHPSLLALTKRYMVF